MARRGDASCPTDRGGMQAPPRAPLVLSLAALIAGCDGLSLDRYWRSGDYELIAIDAKGQMSLSVDLHNGDAIGLVGPSVCSLGSDEKRIVVKQHPARDAFGNFDRSVTNYFVVIKVVGSATEKQKAVRGPLSKSEFDRLAAAENLPTFTKTFADLQ